PQGEAAARWRSFENLVQMAWFEHPVNERRLHDGRLPLTGLWLEGRADAARTRAFDRVYTDDPAVAGLARRAGSGHAAFAAFGANAAQTPPSILVDAGFWREALAEGNADAWNDAWLAFDRWFEQGPRHVASLHLVLTGERDCVEVAVESADRFKPWRSLVREALLERAQ